MSVSLSADGHLKGHRNKGDSVLEIVLATSNLGKLKEFHGLLSDLPFKIIPQSDFNLEDAEEIGLTFVENAIIKARHAAEKTGYAALADDSGLVVDALEGKPGIYSARYAGPMASSADNIEKLLLEMKAVSARARTARFMCVLVFLRHALDPCPLIAQGAWEGEILMSPRGDNGFGYDPVFWVPTHQCSAAELSSVIKNSVSHRALACQFLQSSFLANAIA